MMASRSDLERLIRELDELVVLEEAAKKAVRSLRMRRGLKARKVRTLAGQLAVDVGVVRGAMTVVPPVVRVPAELELTGDVCDVCDGRGGDGLCRCGGTGWID